MAAYNTIPNQSMMVQQQQQTPMQYPYGSNMLLNNNPYDYNMGRINNSQAQQLNINNNQFLKCRPVASKEQARAFQIDLDGSLWVFTDLGNEKIYTKQINNDGTATFKTYAFTKDEDPYQADVGNYVTRQEFQKTISNLMAAIHTDNNQNVSVANNPNNSGETLIGFN